MNDTRDRLRESIFQGTSLEPARASVPDASERDGEQLKLAGFYVGGALYGIEIMRIKEVIQARPYPIRPVPHAPAIVEGVIQLRGVVIPVIDLRRRFGSAIDTVESRFNKLIIVSVGGRIVGLKVDSILGELRAPSSALRPAPSMLRPQEEAAAEVDFFAGVCHVGTEMVFVVNLEALIDPNRSAPPRGHAPAEAAVDDDREREDRA
ncbi:MAG: chemotaxis protein CheW [Nannocystaceae bacterium]|nr:chemotaxis protein CheW [Nannocystaceae bacterium]